MRLQVGLCASSDEEVATKALATLQRTDPGSLAGVVEGADVEWLEILIEKLPHPTILEAVLQRRKLPARLTRRLASWVPADLQEILLLRQDDIRDHPEILDALDKNPYVSSNSRRISREYRTYLVPRRGPIAPPTEEELEDITPEVIHEAIEDVAERIEKKGEFDESTGLTENQIRGLPVSVRLKLAFGASKTLRNILLRDPSHHVSLTALNHSAIADREVEQLCRARTTSEEVLTEVARHREWLGKYQIMMALVRNPRTPVGISVRCLPRVATRDLKILGVDRNLPDAVRSRARLLHRQKVR